MTRSRSNTTRRLAGIVVATLVMLSAAPSFASALSYTFMSRGYGHGLGMSQYGAKAFAERGYGYERILRHYYGNQGTDPRMQVSSVRSEPLRDVNLDRDANYASTGNAGFTKPVWTLRPGMPGSQLMVYSAAGTVTSVDGWATFTASGDRVALRLPDGRQYSYQGTVIVWGISGSPQLTQVKEGTGHYAHTYVRFRGRMLVTAKGGLLKLVNRVNTPEYLYGVVPRESPASWHMEALKAQAVAARGYAMTSTRTELYTTTADQVYGGHSEGENRATATLIENARTNAAVDATLGRIVTYDGKAVRTYFMSTSGGHTENNENVWGGTALPYLRGVPDPYEVYSGASRHPWKYETFTDAEVRSKLLTAGITSAIDAQGQSRPLPNPIADIRVTGRGVSGRPLAIRFTSTSGELTYLTGSTNMDKFKRAFGWGDRWFYVDYKTTRISGASRYETSVVASKRAYTTAATVVVANGNAPADALAASSLAGAVGAPILLTSGGTLDPAVAAEIARLGATKAYVIGGTGVIPDALATQIDNTGSITSVTRLAGADRYGTAKAIALETDRFINVTRVIVVSGDRLADAVAASAFAAGKKLPIIPVKAGSIPPDSRAALDALAPGTSLVIGGTASVSDAVMASLPNGRRIVAGADRYDSARQLAWHLESYEGFDLRAMYLASGVSLADGLAIGPLAGKNSNPVLFAKPYDLTTPTRLEFAARKNTLWRVHIAGGDAALSGWVQGQVESVLE